MRTATRTGCQTATTSARATRCKISPGTCGCGTADTDVDADGLVDCLGQGNLAEFATLSGSGLATDDSFGASVAVDGDTLVVGAPLSDFAGLADVGTAYRYRRDASGAWSLVDTLRRPAAAAGDRFGQAVAARGGFVAVGAPKGSPTCTSPTA